MKHSYKTKGTCSSMIEIEINDESKIIESARFVGGCAGNTAGISLLVKGMSAAEAMQKLQGVKCGAKKTSCPDQLSIAISEVLEQIDKTNKTDNK